MVAFFDLFLHELDGIEWLEAERPEPLVPTVATAEGARTECPPAEFGSVALLPVL
jgi:hypothetical protein